MLRPGREFRHGGGPLRPVCGRRVAFSAAVPVRTARCRVPGGRILMPHPGRPAGRPRGRPPGDPARGAFRLNSGVDEWRCLVCPAGPGCAVGGGPPASRPRREPSARRVVSKPCQAPPPPTGTAARPSEPSGALHTSGAFTADVARRVGSKPCQAPLPPSGTVAGPSGALHTCGAWCAHGFSASARCPAWLQRLNPRRPVVLRWRQAPD